MTRWKEYYTNVLVKMEVCIKLIFSPYLAIPFLQVLLYIYIIRQSKINLVHSWIELTNMQSSELSKKYNSSISVIIFCDNLLEQSFIIKYSVKTKVSVPLLRKTAGSLYITTHGCFLSLFFCCIPADSQLHCRVPF